MEIRLILLFAACLLGSVFCGISILPAMCFGFFLFFYYGIRQGKTVREMLGYAWSGVSASKNVLTTFLIIGMVTGVWRAAGTIAYIVYHASALCSPQDIILVSFLLCCLLSFLTGTSFGSAATMGVICMTLAESMGASPVLTGGAILSGIYFGDRCSPMSTSALLVSSITGTDIFDNLKGMARRSVVPFVLTCILYGAAGLFLPASEAQTEVTGLLAENYRLEAWTTIPAALVLLLSFFRVPVRRTLTISCIAGLVCCIWGQLLPVWTSLKLCIFGFHPVSAELAGIMGGGGVLSMLHVFFIVLISSSYAGMFRGTDFLNGVQEHILSFSRRTSPFCTLLVSSVVIGAAACNQTLTILLTHQLCEKLPFSKQELALGLEDTAVVLCPLIPWCIAGAVPLAIIGAPALSLPAAAYLYLLPLCQLVRENINKRRWQCV